VDFSPRFADLAQMLIENLTTPYEKTVAITNYLRSELEYVDRMPLAPIDRDPIEWALFDQKQGFCNYYASAEVLMLRSLGIPARLAVGYAHGERESNSGRIQYTVRLRDAHAWPEVYFPGIGWVEFEPTANQDPLIRPTDPSDEGISLEEELRLLRQERQSEAPQPDIQQPETLTSDEFLAQEEARNFVPSMIFVAAVLSLLATFWFRRRLSAAGPDRTRFCAARYSAAKIAKANGAPRRTSSINARLHADQLGSRLVRAASQIRGHPGATGNGLG
jgi:hypothetical protein